MLNWVINSKQSRIFEVDYVKKKNELQAWNWNSMLCWLNTGIKSWNFGHFNGNYSSICLLLINWRYFEDSSIKHKENIFVANSERYLNLCKRESTVRSKTKLELSLNTRCYKNGLTENESHSCLLLELCFVLSFEKRVSFTR